MTNSPLGQYAPLVATVTSLLVIGGYVLALIVGEIPEHNLEDLKLLAFVAVGAVFGSAVSTNGWKQPLMAANKRLDLIGAPPANDGAPVKTPVV